MKEKKMKKAAVTATLPNNFFHLCFLKGRKNNKEREKIFFLPFIFNMSEKIFFSVDIMIIFLKKINEEPPAHYMQTVFEGLIMTKIKTTFIYIFNM